jgi:hypothetical protein
MTVRPVRATATPSITFVLPKPSVVETLVSVAESGNVDAMNLLGVLYDRNAGGARYVMALYWFQRLSTADRPTHGQSRDDVSVRIGLSRDLSMRCAVSCVQRRAATCTAFTALPLARRFGHRSHHSSRTVARRADVHPGHDSIERSYPRIGPEA